MAVHTYISRRNRSILRFISTPVAVLTIDLIDTRMQLVGKLNRLNWLVSFVHANIPKGFPTGSPEEDGNEQYREKHQFLVFSKFLQLTEVVLSRRFLLNYFRNQRFVIGNDTLQCTDDFVQYQDDRKGENNHCH